MAILKYTKAKAPNRFSVYGVARYVLNDKKTPDKIIGVIGPYRYREITPLNVYKSFWANKEKMKNTEGKQYHHGIIAFPPNEKITAPEVYDFASEFCSETYPGHQVLIVVHQGDKKTKGLHAHFIIDSVNYLNGKKLHRDNSDTRSQKEVVNEMCKEKGYSITEKGKDMNGKDLHPDTVISWDNDKFQQLKKANPKHKANETNIDMLKLVLLIIQALIHARNVTDFIEYMKRNSWKVTWKENHKHITFESEKTGRKFRATNIDKTYGAKLRYVFGEDFVLDKEHMKKMCETNLEHKTKLYGSRADMITNEAKLDLSNISKKENEKNIPSQKQPDPWEPPKTQAVRPKAKGKGKLKKNKQKNLDFLK